MTEPVQVWGVGVRKDYPQDRGWDDYVVFVIGPEGDPVDVLRTKDMRAANASRIVTSPAAIRDALSTSEVDLVRWLHDQAIQAETEWPQTEAAVRLQRAADVISTLRDDLEQAGVPDHRAQEPLRGRIVMPSDSPKQGQQVGDLWLEDSDLPPGQYTFQVLAGDTTDIEVTPGRVVTPPEPFNDADRSDFGGYLGWVVPQEVHPRPGDVSALVAVHVNIPLDELEHWGPMTSVRVTLAEAAGSPSEPPESVSEAEKGGGAVVAAEVRGMGVNNHVRLRVAPTVRKALHVGDHIGLKLPSHIADKWRDVIAAQTKRNKLGRTYCSKDDNCAFEDDHEGDCRGPDGKYLEDDPGF